MSALTRARHLAAVGRHALAEQEVRAALATDPADTALLSMLSYVLRGQQRYLEALEAANTAVASAPADVAALLELAYAQVSLDQWSGVQATATALIRLAPDQAEHHRLYAVALLEREDHVGAYEAVRRALAAAPQDPDTLVTLARVQWKLGWRDAAVATAHRVLADDPQHYHARWFLVEVDVARRSVRSSLSGLADIARDHPTADPAAQLWPAARTLSRTLRWLPPLSLVVAAAVAVGASAGPPAHSLLPAGARLVAAAAVVGTAVYAGRLLVPARGAPWRAARALPPTVRRAFRILVAAFVVEVAVFVLYCATGWTGLALTLPAVSLAHVLGYAGYLGVTAASDAGFRQQLTLIARELKALPAEVRKAFREGFADDDGARPAAGDGSTQDGNPG